MMTDADLLSERFEAHRPRLRGVAYRMLGSHAESDDVVQDAWLRLSRMDPTEVARIDNLAGWLTTVVGRLSLDRVRSRARHRTESLDTPSLPDPIVQPLRDPADERIDPASAAELAESVSLALLVVLDTLPPAERLAFILHDTFSVPFEEIAPIVQRSPEATRQLASRARRRLRDTPADAEARARIDTERQRSAVEAWVAAATGGNFEALVDLLDPDAVLRVDTGRPNSSKVVHGATAIASGASSFRMRRDLRVTLVAVNGSPGVIAHQRGRVVSLAHFAFGPDGRIVALSIIADPGRLAGIPVPE
jgi:RNA polymerase sigma-70 factor (ECF subfamily)